MRGTVVATFRGMFEVGRIFRHEALEKFLKITPRSRIGIFHDDETAARVPDEYDGETVLDAALADGSGNLMGQFVRSFAAG